MNPLRFAVVGAGRAAGIGCGRGRTFVNGAAGIPEHVVMTTICDLDPETVKQWSEQGVKAYQNYNDLLADPEIDAVCISTPVQIHAKQAIQALNAGKHVLSEVPAAYTMEECYGLIEAVERTGLTYMMAENYCYIRPVMMVQNMVEQGIFGDLIHADGAYLHDCRSLMFDADGTLTWRGNIHKDYVCNTYPTHSMGPVCKWLGINKTDKLKRLSAYGSPSYAVGDYAKRNFGPNHPQASRESWKLPNSLTSLLNTENGVLIEHRLDWASPRPHNMQRYGLQGTKAAFISDGEPGGLGPRIWIEGRSATNEQGIAGAWDPWEQYLEEFDHPMWKEHQERASKAGHGGGDYFILREFALAVHENRAPMVDVYDAVAWSSVAPLSGASIANGNNAVEVPDWKNLPKS